MENIKSKPLSVFVFSIFLALICIRPFFSGLAYPTLEIIYESIIIYLFLVNILINKAFKVPTPYNKALLLMLSAYIISLFFSFRSPNLPINITELLKFISYVFMFLLVYQASPAQKKTILKSIIISGMIISVYAVYQYFWGYTNTIEYLGKNKIDFLEHSSYARDILLGKRAIGTFPSPTILGGYLITIFFMSIYMIKNPSIQRKRLLVSIPILAALILTKSMGCWVALIISFIFLLPLSYNFLKKYKFRFTGFSILILLALSFIIFTRWERLMNLENPDNSLTQRINYWLTALAVIKDNIISGVGPGNFKEVFLNYKVGLSTNTIYAHNIFLHTWAELGILGIVSISWIIFTFLKKCGKLAGSIYIYLAGAAFLLHNLIDNSYLIPQVGFLWWVLLGLAREND